MTIDIEKNKQEYLEEVYSEMKRRGYTPDEIPKVIAKTGFLNALNEYPEEQFHYSAEDAVDEILFVAAKY